MFPMPAPIIATASATALAAGHLTGNWLLGSVAALFGLCMLGLFSPRASGKRRSKKECESTEREDWPGQGSDTAKADPADKMLRQGRAALLLRPMVLGELGKVAAAELTDAFREQMAFIHAGAVRVPSWVRVGEGDVDGPELIVQVAAFWMDRHPVTNRQFAQFVEAGGYLNLAFWREESHPMVGQFVDQCGNPGPRPWKSQWFQRDEADYPVTGVSWYECDAYATWAGKRLPSDPEWMKAAAWPLETENQISQWTFPWGNQLNSDQAQLWTGEPLGPCDVGERAAGQNPVGVKHLIGNVWEWMHDDFCLWDSCSPFQPDSVLASIRGGAFDTFFESQATSAFFSAEHRSERKANIGFRCVVSAVDVVCQPPALPTDATSTSESNDARSGGSR